MGLPNIGPIELLIVLAIPVGTVWLVVRSVRGETRRSQQRICPACGTPAAEGEIVCGRCGFDYQAAARIASGQREP